MPRVRFAVEFEDVEGNVVVAFSDIPAQTKQEAVEKGFAYLNTLTATATKQKTFSDHLANALNYATMNAVYGKSGAAEETKDAEPNPAATKATKGKRKGK